MKRKLTTEEILYKAGKYSSINRFFYSRYSRKELYSQFTLYILATFFLSWFFVELFSFHISWRYISILLCTANVYWMGKRDKAIRNKIVKGYSKKFNIQIEGNWSIWDVYAIISFLFKNDLEADAQTDKETVQAIVQNLKNEPRIPKYRYKSVSFPSLWIPIIFSVVLNCFLTQTMNLDERIIIAIASTKILVLLTSVFYDFELVVIEPIYLWVNSETQRQFRMLDNLLLLY